MRELTGSSVAFRFRVSCGAEVGSAAPAWCWADLPETPRVRLEQAAICHDPTVKLSPRWTSFAPDRVVLVGSVTAGPPRPRELARWDPIRRAQALVSGQLRWVLRSIYGMEGYWDGRSAPFPRPVSISLRERGDR